MRSLLRSVIILLLAAGVAFGAEVPYLSGRVNDNAEILSPETRRSLSEQLKAHEDKTGNQIVVLTIPTLGGESIEEYAVKVFQDWKLGQRGKDNGVLVVVSIQDRRMRIEVGYGLEPTLTDLMAGRIIRNVMTPRFKAGDYNGGVLEGVQAIITVLEKGEAAGPAAGTGQDEKGTSSSGSGLDSMTTSMSLSERILIGAFIFGIIGLFTVIGVLTPGVGWFLYLFLIPFWGAFPMMVVGTKVGVVLLGIYLIGYPLAKLILRNREWYKKAALDLKTKGSANLGGFTLTSGGGGWSSGSGSSGGGGFSGGGGSSGGGGASGGW